MSQTLVSKLLSNSAVRYLIAGGFSFVIELGVLFVLSEIIKLSPVVSVGISFWVGLIVAFLLQKFFTFKNKTLQAKRVTSQTIQYGLLVLINYAFTLWFVNVLHLILGLFIARAIALIITTVWNYFAYKYILFSDTNMGLIAKLFKKKSGKRTLLFTLSTVLGLFLIGYVTLGVFSRPMADDLIFLSAYGTSDFAQNLNSLYGVNGRFTSLTIYLLGYTIPIISQLTALITFLIMGAGIYLLATQFLKSFVEKSLLKPVVLCLTLTILTAFAILTPSPASSIFWFSAAVVHIWSYGFILILMAYLLKMRSQKKLPYSRRSLALYFATTLLVGLFGEMAALTIIALHLFILIVDAIQKNKKRIQLSITGALAGIAAFAWLYFAPASIARRANLSAMDGLSTSDFIKNLPKELYENIVFKIPDLFQNIYVLILVFLAAVLLGLYFTTKASIKKQTAIVILVVASILTVFHIVNFSVTYVAGGYIPLRIYAASSLSLILATFLFGFIFAYFLKGRTDFVRGITIGSLATLSILVLIFSTAFIPWGVALGNELGAHAHAWDNRNSDIKTQIEHNTCTVKVASLPIGDVADLSEDPLYWINLEGAENYYSPPNNPSYWDKCTIQSIK